MTSKIEKNQENGQKTVSELKSVQKHPIEGLVDEFAANMLSELVKANGSRMSQYRSTFYSQLGQVVAHVTIEYTLGGNNTPSR